MAFIKKRRLFASGSASSKSAIWLRTLSRSSGSAISSGVSPTRLRRGATGTPALLRRAIAWRLRPPPAIGIEAKSGLEFRAEAVPLLIIDPPGRGNCHHGCDEQMFGEE
jgi:hypothetical protein